MKNTVAALLILSVVSCGKKETSSVPDFNNAGVSAKTEVENSNATKIEGNKNLSGFALIQRSDCLSCHKDNEKFVGPSYAEIATKYSDKDTGALADKILNGGSGVWGNVPMAPHPNVTKDDAKKMVEYILSLKK